MEAIGAVGTAVLASAPGDLMPSGLCRARRALLQEEACPPWAQHPRAERAHPSGASGEPRRVGWNLGLNPLGPDR